MKKVKNDQKLKSRGGGESCLKLLSTSGRLMMINCEQAQADVEARDRRNYTEAVRTGPDDSKRNRYLFLSFGQTIASITNTDNGNSDLPLATTTWMEKHCMWLGLLTGGMMAAILVDLAVLQPVCDVLMRTVQSVDPKRKPSSEATCRAKKKNGSREWHMCIAPEFKAMHA